VDTPPEFRRKTLDLVAPSLMVADVARDWQISRESICVWRYQHRIDRGDVLGLSVVEKSDLAAARKRITELEAEIAAHDRASELLGKAAARSA
jgi:transposase-like protein